MVEVSLPSHVASRRRDGRHEVLLHRAMALVGDDRIEIKSARSTVLIPLAALALSVAAGVVLATQNTALPLWAMVGLLVFALLAAPVSVMALIGATLGADVVVDATKNSVTFQQGYLGMGIGTKELVPFQKIDHLEVTIEGAERDRWRNEADSFRQFAIVLVKVSGKRLVLANVPVPAANQEDGMDRTLAVAHAIAAVTGTSVRLPDGWELVEIDTDTGEIIRPAGGQG
ncbi:MAG: hypothetical protein Kow0010_05000 [Dehalococcoidia bacterium]